MSSDATRAKIAEEQAQLLAALVTNGAAPDGFDPDRLKLCAASLESKRLRTILRLHPLLSEILGEDCRSEFDCYVSTRQQGAHPGGSNADAQAFIAFLQDRGRLPRRNILQRLLQQLLQR